MKRVGIIAVTVLVACGGGGTTQAATTTTSTAASSTLTVHIVAEEDRDHLCHPPFMQPFNSTTRLVAKDGAGTVIGTALLSTTPGFAFCDYTTSFTLTGHPDFVSLESDQGPFVTLSSSDIASGRVTLSADTSGHVAVSS